MNPQARPFAYPTVSPLPAPSTPPAPAVIELDSDARWNEWTEKGRRENAAFKEKARILAAAVGVAASMGGVIWTLLAAR